MYILEVREKHWTMNEINYHVIADTEREIREWIAKQEEHRDRWEYFRWRLHDGSGWCDSSGPDAQHAIQGWPFKKMLTAFILGGE